MKLRIKGNSLRLRLGRSEFAHFLKVGRLEETICFAPSPEAKLTYAIETSPAITMTSVRYRPQEVAVMLTADQVDRWRREDEVGIYAEVRIGQQGILEVIVEKDFACLDRGDEENGDTFANPGSDVACRTA